MALLLSCHHFPCDGNISISWAIGSHQNAAVWRHVGRVGTVQLIRIRRQLSTRCLRVGISGDWLICLDWSLLDGPVEPGASSALATRWMVWIRVLTSSWVRKKLQLAPESKRNPESKRMLSWAPSAGCQAVANSNGSRRTTAAIAQPQVQSNQYAN